MDTDCLELFLKRKGGELPYRKLLNELTESYSNIEESFTICRHSLGTVLALDYTIKYPEKVASLILIAGQYKAPVVFMRLQCILFGCMPQRMKRETVRSFSIIAHIDHGKSDSPNI